MRRPNPDLPPAPGSTSNRPSLRPPNLQKNTYHTCRILRFPLQRQDQNFPLLLLPTELQNQIWTHAARDWISHNLRWELSPDASGMTSPKHYLALFTEEGEHFEFPVLLSTCSAARNAFYDALRTPSPFDTPKIRAGQNSGNLLLFLGEHVWSDQDCEFPIALGYALRIQDFRLPNLESRIREEDGRIRQQQIDIDEMARRWQAQEDGKTYEELEEMGIGEYNLVVQRPWNCFFHLELFREKYYPGLAKGQTSFGFD